ncbi:anthranilate synthase component I family protein [Alteribacillus sp. JSM 102045]|uniref:anthranilate synthase component I family protein n=1 Tax=Alteribacillus sp. JSM 102045 TaxID=1562101 RepID=UPI0035BEC1B2
MASSFLFPEQQFFSSYQALSADKNHHILLESGQRGRYSIAGLTPFAVIKGKNNSLFIKTRQESVQKSGEPLEEMKKWLEPYKVNSKPNLPDFQGGILGYISYDYIRYIEDLPMKSSDDLNTHDLYFLAFHQVFIYDHEEKKMWIIVHYADGKETKAKADIQRLKVLWQHPPHFSWDQYKKVGSIRHNKNLVPSFTERTFTESVRKVQEYIRAGDVFQVNLSVRQTRELSTPPFHIYEKLREFNPSPYMGYMHTPEFQLVSGSPELLVKKRGEEASTRPIAGTRPRGTTAEQDKFYEKELIATEKERAEHVMLVDLERNDLGKVCTYGSVEVDELMVIERYSHVMHIVSNVKGKLAEHVDEYDMIKAAFPGGTITGAPKIRTMEIIEELEPVRRGMYTGSIGWIGFNGDMELNIAIRTMIAKDGMAYVQAGAGIVIDSSPEAEYQESLKKARALWKAQEISEEEMAVKHSRAEEEKVYDFND